uniref:Uncharacterized protein n=1 Tax=Mustela putorius furo TaxID=9669 RepID=M3XZX1_MUSPF
HGQGTSPPWPRVLCRPGLRAGWAAGDNGELRPWPGAGIAGRRPSRTNPQRPSCASARATAKQPRRQITEDFKQLQVGRAWNHQAALRPPPH